MFRFSKNALAWEAYGCTVSVEWTKESLSAIAERLPLPGWKASDTSEASLQFILSETGPGISLLLSGQELFSHLSRRSAELWLQTSCYHELAKRSPKYLFIHASSVKRKDQLIVLPGRTYCGKSALALELINEGCSFFSDGYVMIDKLGRVHPFPKTLMLRQGLTTKHIDPFEIGFNGEESPMRSSFFIFSEYRPGQPFEINKISQGETLLRLLDNTITVRDNPKRAIEWLNLATDGTLSAKNLRGEAIPAAASILDWLIQQPENRLSNNQV